MVQHHLTDDVSDPALLFFPPLPVCVFLIRNTRQRKIQKKNTITHSPLECTHVRGQTALQPISPYQGEMGGPPKATTSGVGRADVTFFFFPSRLQSSVFVDVQRECGGSPKKHVMSHEIM